MSDARGAEQQIIYACIVQSIIGTKIVALWVNSLHYTATFRSDNTV